MKPACPHPAPTPMEPHCTKTPQSDCDSHTSQAPSMALSEAHNAISPGTCDLWLSLLGRDLAP